MSDSLSVTILTREVAFARFAKFEAETGWTTAEFFARWRGGDSSLDQPEYFPWASMCYLAARAGWIEVPAPAEPLPPSLMLRTA